MNCGKKRDFVHRSSMKKEIDRKSHPFTHGLRTSNESINQRNLKFGLMLQTKYASAVPKDLGVGVDFWPCNKSDFLIGRP